MLAKYVRAVVTILGVLAGWVLVQHLARLFARRHPEFGPLREEGAGCGTWCGCSKSEQEACRRRTDEVEEKRHSMEELAGPAASRGP